MSIFICYCPLQHILPDWQFNQRMKMPDRDIVRTYRLTQLQKIHPNLQLTKNQYGKPIAANCPDFAFNHSHSQNFYALAYAKHIQFLGIDIEDFSRNVRMYQLAQHYFHPEEIINWQRTEYSREFWFKVWTIKEAVLKAHGLGIGLDLKTLNTQASLFWDFGRVEHQQLGKFTYQCFKFPDSMLTVAYQSLGKTPFILPISFI